MTKQPKNIVLLSDGTGNSSAQLLKTNVWRVYDSLNLTNPSTQVACYDDGVGTSSFKPLTVVGGAFGLGLRRNVLRLYRFLCEHYDPGDQIFLFGFSRGAFTVRVLAQLICRQGIIKTRPTLPVSGATMVSDARASGQVAAGVATLEPAASVTEGLARGSELARRSRWAYRGYRREFRQTGGLVAVARWARDVVFKAWDRVRGLEPYDPRRNHEVDEIAFIGVWDTVDAYGLPIDELTNGIDKWVWPLSMPDLTLDPKVTRACHVLALDDERNTFHPVLWDEKTSKQPQNCADIRDERITQVWFAGMHSNVGGGYADDALSAVSLKWMTDQVKDKLQFVRALLVHHTAKADPLGRLYDSRKGIKGYYRYNPRKIEWLTNGLTHERVFGKGWPRYSPVATIERPKIHESVFTRMSAAPEAYAPIVFPRRYAVVMEDGRILDKSDNPFESPEAAERRCAAQERAWDLVWWRRVAYFAAVGVTAVLLLRPFREGADAAMGSANGGTAGRIVAALREWLPSMTAPWTEYFTARPWELFAGLATLIALSRIGTSIQGRICYTMRGIWLKVIPPAIGEYTQVEPHTSRLLSIRSSALYQGLYAVLRRTVLPTVFGIATLFWLAGAANRAGFEAFNLAGTMCSTAGAVTRLQVGQSRTVSFASGDFCGATGLELEAATRYEMTFAIASSAHATGDDTSRRERAWSDGAVATTYWPRGFNSRSPGLTALQRVVFTAFVPFRRVWSAEWFVPVARIGETGLDQYALKAEKTTLVARTTGELHLFVNDAILPVNVIPRQFGWDAYYGNNNGSAMVTVVRLSDE